MYEPITSSFSFLSGGGKTGELIRSANWATTPIGEPQTWPPHLRMALRIMLDAPFPMKIAWRSGYLQFYNDRYIPFLDAGKHPEVLGKSMQETFDGQWDVVKPIFDSALTGKPIESSTLRLLVSNNGFGKPSFTVSTSFIYDENGAVDGLIIMPAQTLGPHLINDQPGLNEKINGAFGDDLSLAEVSKNQKVLEESAIQSPIAVAILKSRDLIIEMANEALLSNIWKKTPAETRGRKLFELFPELNDQLLPASINDLFETGKAYKQSEVLTLIRSREGIKKFYLNYEYAPLLETDGSVAGVMMTVLDVTEQVLARQLIEDAEQRSRLAIEAAAMGTFDWNLVTQEFASSERLIAIFGYPNAKHISHNILIDGFHPDDKPIRDKAVRQSFTKGSLQYEARVIRPDKSIRWVKVFGKIVYNELQRPLRMYGMVTDVTDEKTTHIALEESENRLNVAVNAAMLATYDVDVVDNTVLASPRLYEIFNIPEGAIITRQSIMDSLHPDDVPVRNLAHETALLTGRVEYETRIIWPDKSVHWIKVNGKMFFDENHAPVRILGTAMDITGQKFYTHQLEESEKRFKMVADTAPVMLWMSNAEMLSTFFNKSWLAYTGRTLEQELGNGWLESVHPDDIPGCTEVFTNAFHKREEFYMEYRIRRHDGVYRWTSDKGIPRINADGVFLGHIGACQDIDDQKRLNEKLTKSEARLRIAALSGELGTWDYDPVSNELYWDEACGEIFGVGSSSKSSADLFFSLIEPADLQMAAEKAAMALDPNIAANFDIEFRIKGVASEQIRWVNGKGKAFFANGVAYRFAGTVLDITDKKLALQALQSSELLFKTISNASPVGLWLTDEFGHNTFVNNTWINWTGISFDKQINEGWLSVVVDDDKEVTLGKFTKAFEMREKFSAEFRLRNHQNEICWCLTEGYPYYNNKGNFAGYAGSVTDITAHRTAMRSLKKSEERFKLLANAMPQFIWTGDQLGNLNYFNQSVYNYTGHTEESILREGWITIVHPEDRDENIRRWMHSVKTGEDFFFEHRFKGKNGEYKWQLSRALPQRAANGDIHMWIGTSTDIHDQKLAAEELENKVRQRTAELQKVNEEINQQKDFVEIIIDSSLILVTVFDTEKRIISFNKKCEEVFGLKKENVLGKLFEDVFPAIKTSKTYTNLERALAGETFHESSYRSVVNNNYYESYFVSLKDKNDQVYAVLMTAHDITDIIQSTEKVQHAYSILEEQNKALERSNQELESFSYVASHDLQEPLRKIQTFIELLHRNLDNKEVSEKYFEKITTSAQRMAYLIRDVLNYSKLSTQGENYVSVDLNIILEDVKTDFELLITEKHATITNNNLPVIKGIPLQVHQLFTNLLSNALKFSVNDPVIKIDVHPLSSDDVKTIAGLNNSLPYTHITFSDNGIGFEQQFAEKIFAIFQRLNNRQYSGTGIGLALCKKIIENHFGVIAAESEPNKGATFHIYLPLKF
jgi:PAS domain S-box-containing protein